MGDTWIEVKVKPRSRESSLEEAGDGSWIARIKSPPVDGTANRELVVLVAKRFGVPKSAVEIRTGAASRWKRIRISE